MGGGAWKAIDVVEFSCLTIGERKAQRWGVFAQGHTAVGSKARIPGSHLGIGSAVPCLWKVSCKASCSRFAQLSLSGTHQGVLLFWSIMGPWFSSFSGNLSFHFVSKHLVNSWNMSDIVPVTGLTALNRKDPKLELWGGLWRSPQYDWLKCRGGFCPSGSGEGSSGAMVFEQRLKEEPGGGDSVLN